MKRRSLQGAIALAVVCLWLSPGRTAEEKPAKVAKSRTFQFDYGVTLTKLPADAKVRVWLPVPTTNEYQQVKSLVQPTGGKEATEPKYGNQIFYLETKSPQGGKLALESSYLITRQEVQGLSSNGKKVKLSPDQRKLFLQANEKVPVGGKPAQLLAKVELPSDTLALGRKLYEAVDDHMKYDKSKPGYGSGDAVWACDSRFGNCTDFHSLFISWARIRGVPARFEIGFPLPPERGKGDIGGYHCWAFFHVHEHGWVPVDISEADKHPDMKTYYFGNLTEDRVTFTAGRDITLVPRQTGPPLNFFVYPYVEVNGKVWPKNKIELSFAYADQ